MTKHTPGPWKITEITPGHYPGIMDAKNTLVASCSWVTDETDANARLIAAAPDLLAACERVLRSIDWATTEDRLTAIQEAQVLRDAIAKATGD